MVFAASMSFFPMKYNLRPAINKERIALACMSYIVKLSRLARREIDIRDYKMCSKAYKDSSELRSQCEALMDRALHLKIKPDSRLANQLINLIAVSESLEKAFMESLDRSGRLVHRQRTRSVSDDNNDNNENNENNDNNNNNNEDTDTSSCCCAICCTDNGRWAPALVCCDQDQLLICRECYDRLEKCPYCRAEIK